MVGEFEEFGIVGGAFVEFVVDMLYNFALRVAEFDVLSRVAEGEGGVLSSEVDRFVGLHGETLGDFVIDEVFGGEFRLGGDAPPFKVNFFL